MKINISKKRFRDSIEMFSFMNRKLNDILCNFGIMVDEIIMSKEQNELMMNYFKRQGRIPIRVPMSKNISTHLLKLKIK